MKIQTTVSKLYKVIRTGNARDKILNQGKILGGMYAFSKTPKRRQRIPR